MGGRLRKASRVARRHGWRFLLLTALLPLATCHIHSPLFASEPQTDTDRSKETETRIKVAYIYNFLKFIEWPQDERSPTTPYRICPLGTDSIRTIMGELSIRKVRGRAIEITQLKDLRETKNCHLVYVCRSEEQDLQLLLERLAGASVLSVSDIPQFARRGGMIGFVTEADRVKIEINVSSVRRAGLKASAKLLEIARIVQ